MATEHRRWIVPGAGLIRLLVFVHDVAWVVPAIGLAYWLRFNLGAVPESYAADLSVLLLAALVAHPLANAAFGLYRGVWRFASVPDLLVIAKAVAAGAGLALALAVAWNRLEGVPRSLLLLYPLLLAVMLAAPRLLYRHWVDRRRFRLGPERRAFVVGSGPAAELLIRDILRDPTHRYLPVAVFDDALRLHGARLHGVKIEGPVAQIAERVGPLGGQVVLVAQRDCSEQTLREVFALCERLKLPVRLLPSPGELAQDRTAIGALRTVTIEDLLRRAPVQLDHSRIDQHLRARRVVVTGAGGSIGGELCAQISIHEPAELILVDQSELALRGVLDRLQLLTPQCAVVPVLADVADRAHMQRLFAERRPQLVLHAAACKHVDLLEDNPLAAVRSNVLGTRSIIDAARAAAVDSLLLVSTDKAVEPVSVLGLTKRLAEHCVRAAGDPALRTLVVRFGNVLDSTGSVVPRFREQIRRGGPVTLTSAEMTRYFMTLPEAAQLILETVAIGECAGVYALDMGEPVRILDLAEQMIRLHGLEPGHDVRLEITGERPGERLHEPLCAADETMQPSRHPKVLRVCGPPACPAPDLAALEQALAAADAEAALHALHALLPAPVLRRAAQS